MEFSAETEKKYQRLLRYMKRKEGSYFFVSAIDERLIFPITQRLEKELLGLKIVRLENKGASISQQLKEFTNDSVALVVSNTGAFFYNNEQNTSGLNFEREIILALNVPIAFWASESTLSYLASNAIDFFNKRSYSTLRFEEQLPPNPLFESALPIITEPRERLKRIHLFEKQRQDDSKYNNSKKQNLTSILLPLAKEYAFNGQHQKSTDILIPILDDLDKTNPSILYDLGELYEALTDFEHAIIYFEQASVLFNQRKNYLRVASTYERLGLIYQIKGNFDKALVYFEDFSKLIVALYYENNFSTELKNYLVISYSRLGNIYEMIGDFDKALYYSLLQTNLSEELYEANRSWVVMKNSLAVSYSNLGDIYQITGSLEKALRNFEKSFDLSKELYESNPNSEQFKKNFANSYSQLGDLYLEQGDFKNAMIYCRRSTMLYEELCESNPKSNSLSNGLAISYFALGNIFLSTSKPKQATEYFKSSQKIWLDLVEKSPNVVEYRNNLNEVKKILSEM